MDNISNFINTIRSAYGSTLHDHILQTIWRFLDSCKLTTVMLSKSEATDANLNLPDKYHDLVVGTSVGGMLFALRLETCPSQAGARPWGLGQYVGMPGHLGIGGAEHDILASGTPPQQEPLDPTALPVTEYQWAIIIRTPGADKTKSWVGTPFDLNRLDEVMSYITSLARKEG